MGNIVFLWLLMVVVIAGVYLMFSNSLPKKVTYAIYGVIIFVSVVGTFFLTNTASFKRFKKDVGSEFSENIEREVTVHSRSGDIIHQSSGKFDVEFSDGRLKWVDEDGKVHIIYLGDSATAVVDELD